MDGRFGNFVHLHSVLDRQFFCRTDSFDSKNNSCFFSLCLYYIVVELLCTKDRKMYCGGKCAGRLYAQVAYEPRYIIEFVEWFTAMEKNEIRQ